MAGVGPAFAVDPGAAMRAETGAAGATGPAATLHGRVVSILLRPGSATEPAIDAGYFQGAVVCVDANRNGRCDAGEPSATTNARGEFTLAVTGTPALLADIGTSAVNTAAGARQPSRLALRAPAAQVAAQKDGVVVISPLSSEVFRMMEETDTRYDVQLQRLAHRIGVSPGEVQADPASVSAAARGPLLREAHALQRRFLYATTKLDRGDRYPDALAVPGGDPELTGLRHVTADTARTPDHRQPITFAQAQQAAFNVEGMPRYDSIFIIMLENEGANVIMTSPYTPRIRAYLTAGNHFTSYFATGNPSEPNYTALAAADDFGIVDDAQWNCNATGPNAPRDVPLPTRDRPGLASSPFVADCSTYNRANHDIHGRPNLFNALSAAGLTWRVYSESMNPGQDVRTDSVTDPAVLAADHVYPPGTLAGNTATVGDPHLVLPMPPNLYKTKHHPGMPFQNVRSAPEWRFSNRTLGGGQWDAGLPHASAYRVPRGYVADQFGADLVSGDVGNLNFLIPDQCDDMHGTAVSGTVAGSGRSETASDCEAPNILARGDRFVAALVRKIQASPLWRNEDKRVAIVLAFDEGSATSGFNACCGWNPGSDDAHPLVPGPNGAWRADTSIEHYAKGNRGHGQSIFGVLTNQPAAPKGVVDSDPYSHFSFVRSLQDIFQIADPAVDASYLDRSKYTEKFIATHLNLLPEYAGREDTHFDAVRPMNHAYVIPRGYRQKQSTDAADPAQVGPDATQKNVWAVR